jgi:hypothetical protein
VIDPQYAAFYVANRERILDSRRKRYQEDPDFRAAQLERVRARRAEKKSEPKKRSPNLQRVFTVDGFPVLMVGLGEAALLTGFSKKGFRVLDDTGTIPRNRVVDHLGRRWYPKDFVEWLVPFLADQGRRREPRWKLKERVERAWIGAEVTNIGDSTLARPDPIGEP